MRARALKSVLGDLILEYNYLSAPEKLIEYQSQYFQNDLTKIDIKKMKKIMAFILKLKNHILGLMSPF